MKHIIVKQIIVHSSDKVGLLEVKHSETCYCSDQNAGPPRWSSPSEINVLKMPETPDSLVTRNGTYKWLVGPTISFFDGLVLLKTSGIQIQIHLLPE